MREIFSGAPIPIQNISVQSQDMTPIKRGYRIQPTLLRFDDVADIGASEHRENIFGKTSSKLPQLELNIKR